LVISSRETPQNVVKLDYPFGPRYFFILNSSFIIFVDEWQRNLRTEVAFEVCDLQGNSLQRFALEDVLKSAGLTMETATASARYGAWLSDIPRVVAAEDALEFSIGDSTFLLALENQGRFGVRAKE
jgi:hypothetical protein